MSDTQEYKQAWEGFWEEAPEGPGEVFWDAGPELVAGPHLAHFEPHLTAPGLPLLDLGCGNGTQTRFFADRFTRVLGADLSAAAIEHARRSDPAGQADYRQLDAAASGETELLHAELGDVNIYMRGVLHQCRPEDRQPLANGIATLVGQRGRAFVVELAQAAGKILMGSGAPPAKLRPVLKHGIAPAELADEEVPKVFRDAGLKVLASGELPLATTEFGPDGSRIELPSHWLVVGRAD